MKNIILYLLSIVTTIIVVYYIKQSKDYETDVKTELRHNDYIRAEIEVLNGCGESGVANLFTKFLRSEGYDVIEIKNADNFQYTETIILFHNQKAQKKAEMLSEILNVNQSNIQFNKNSVWDLSVIIGSDYKNLTSFEEIKKFYELF